MPDRAALVTHDAGAPKRAADPHKPDPLKGGDVYGWAVEQAALIRAGRYDEIDSVSKSEFRALASDLEIVLAHMLKGDHRAKKPSRAWSRSIDEHRERKHFPADYPYDWDAIMTRSFVLDQTDEAP